MIYKIVLLFGLSSCSLFIENYDKDILERNNIIPKNKVDSISCNESATFSLISENERSQKSFRKFLNESPRFTFIEQIVLWSLIQINLRPDQSSPTAKTQMLIDYKGQERFYNSYATGEGRPLLNVLQKILKDYKSKYRLKDLAKILDRNFKEDLYVSNDLEIFLKENKNLILKNQFLKKYFFRADETLKTNERLNKLNFSNLVKNFLNSKNNDSSKITNHLFNYSTEGDIYESQCNFDMNLYEGSVFLISDKKVKSNIFGLKNKDSKFLATTTQSLLNLNALDDTFLLKGSSKVRSSALCSIKNKNLNNKKTWLISDNSRDPGQHIFHLFQYEIHKQENINKTKNMLSFSRHQFLKDPVRLVIESRRSSEKQINDLLKLNIPVYNSKSIGRVWSMFQGPNYTSFILDERNEGHVTCK